MKHPKRRLGAGPDDATPIKLHPFFRDINWAELARKNGKPPFTPPFGKHGDILRPQFFEAEFTSQAPILTPAPSIKLV